jgi:hypothetical protein
MKLHTICINGSRGFTDFLRLRNEMDLLIPDALDRPLKILSGACRGPDLLGEKWAGIKGIPVKRFPAEWNKYGKAAGMIRNKEMIDEADELISFWDGESRGTKDAIDLAYDKGIPVTIIRV